MMQSCQSEPRDISTHKKPELKLFVNPNNKSIYEHRLARCIYAETSGESLKAIEALCVMVKNTGRPIEEISEDENVFESLNKKSTRHAYLLVPYTDRKFQLCLRIVHKIETNTLEDKIFGATKFHREDKMPDWATSIGSIADIDGLLFYI